MELKQFVDLLFSGKIKPIKDDIWNNDKTIDVNECIAGEYSVRFINQLNMKSIFDRIPSKYFNKCITVNDNYKLHIITINTDTDKEYRISGDNCELNTFTRYRFKTIIINYRGTFKPVLWIRNVLHTDVRNVFSPSKQHYIKSYKDMLNFNDFMVGNEGYQLIEF